MKALFSVMDKTDAVGCFATWLHQTGWQLIASSGTKRFLESKGLNVTDTAEITGLKPVLDHRVATLCPQLHGGLLSKEEHAGEMKNLGWDTIELVFVTFYPLQATLNDPKKAFEDINESVDIGGPTLVSSACKGERIVVTDERDITIAQDIIRWPSQSKDLLDWLHAAAAAKVAEYRASESLFRIRKLRPQV